MRRIRRLFGSRREAHLSNLGRNFAVASLALSTSDKLFCPCSSRFARASHTATSLVCASSKPVGLLSYNDADCTDGVG